MEITIIFFRKQTETEAKKPPERQTYLLYLFSCVNDLKHKQIINVHIHLCKQCEGRD